MNRVLKFIKNFFKDENTRMHCLAFVLLTGLIFYFIIRNHCLFASTTDWFKQHVTFANYFRNLFYETGNLFPNFSPHLGAGENIFYIAYYGLFNPIILISYILPFIKMEYFIIVSSLLIIVTSTILLYYFLKRNKINADLAFIISLLFLFSACFIYHSHRQIMFVNYMPFLIAGLIGVIRYFEKKKSLLLIINICLMILTSYYYSVGGILCIFLYGIYYYIKTNNKFSIKDIFLFIFRIILGILLASFLLLPVAYIILNGRESSGITLLSEYFIPRFDIKTILYNGYGLGLTSICWLALVYNTLFGKKENRFLSIILIILTIFPIFNFVLNGGLYLNGKVFIPLMPLYLLLIAYTLKNIKSKKTSWKYYVIGIVISFIFIKVKDNYLFLAVDVLATLAALFAFGKYKNVKILYVIVILSIFICYKTNKNDEYLSYEEYNKITKYLKYDINNYLNNDDNIIYRYENDYYPNDSVNYTYAKNDYHTSMYSSTTNKYYQNSFYDTFNNNNISRNSFVVKQTNNLFFDKFMGVKYLLTNNVPYGYKMLKDYDKVALYENDNVNSIAYFNEHVLSKEEYDKLDFNQQLEAFTNNIITDNKTSNPNLDFKSSLENINYTVQKKKKLSIKTEDDKYIIKAKNNNELILKLDESIVDKILIIRFKIDDKEKYDRKITINNVKNVLTDYTWKYYNNNETFDYIISSNDPIEELKITFTKGTYSIYDIKTYLIDNSYFESGDITNLNITNNNLNNGILQGNIEVLNDGYFIYTIPYDDGFSIYVDDNKVEYEKVNDAFIGFPLEKGSHTIKLEFKAPYFDLGKIISISSLIIVIILCIYEKKKI